MPSLSLANLTRSVLWIAFFVAIIVSWVWLYGMAWMTGVDWIGRPGTQMVMPMTTLRALIPMWAVMMAAMMLPTMVPTLRAYDDLMVSANGTRAGWIGLLVGYLAVWVVFAVVIALVQAGLMRLSIVDDYGITRSRLVAGGLLIVVGLYQFSRTKAVCHGVCHSPTIWFLGHWRPGTLGGLRMGVALGTFCVGCCWGFMALGFIGGVMSLLWMGLATVFMVLEKLPQVGHHLTRPMGAALIFGGLAVAIT